MHHIQHTKTTEFVPFPISVSTKRRHHYAEAYTYSVVDHSLYMSLNCVDLTECGGLWKYTLSARQFTKIFEYRPKDIIYTCRILQGVDRQFFVGTVTTTGEVIVVDLSTNCASYIFVGGTPNDLDCQVVGNMVTIYVGVNMQLKGMLYRIIFDLERKQVMKHVERITLPTQHAVCGVSLCQTAHSILFISTLSDIYKLNIATMEIQTISDASMNWLYDNITCTNQKVVVACFSKNKLVERLVLRSDVLLSLASLYYAVAGINHNRSNENYLQMTVGKHISFVEYDIKQHSTRYVTLDISLPDFDDEVTHIGYVTDRMLVAVNYKACGFMLIYV